jgi:hypothetical protein
MRAMRHDLDYCSAFVMTARASSWLPSAVQLLEMFLSTLDRRAELLASDASIFVLGSQRAALFD